jgi:hypothetical protein
MHHNTGTQRAKKIRQYTGYRNRFTGHHLTGYASDALRGSYHDTGIRVKILDNGFRNGFLKPGML